MKRENKWIEYEPVYCCPCIYYIPTKMRMLSGSRPKLNWQVYVRPGDRQRASVDEMGSLQTINQVHILSADVWWRWDRIIRWEVINNLSKFTYVLETDEEDEMVWWDEMSSNYWPSSRTLWRRMKRMGWDDQMKVFKQLTKFTYILDTEDEDIMG